MGHVHLGVLPKTRPWREVVRLLGDGAPVPTVLSAGAKAAERDLLAAGDDPVFVEAVRLMLLIPNAARATDFGDALRALDLPVSDRPELIDLLAAVQRRLDQVGAAASRRTDLGEIAARALLDALGSQVSADLPSLFDATHADVVTSARKLAGRQGLAALARSFFGRLVGDSLAIWLDRTLSTHVGPGRRFPSASERAGFDRALAEHAYGATRIVQEFVPGWTGKRLAESGTISTSASRDFGSVCLRKIIEELRTGYGSDA